MTIEPMPELCIMGRATDKDLEQIDAVVAWGERGWARVRELDDDLVNRAFDASIILGDAQSSKIEELKATLDSAAHTVREALALLEKRDSQLKLALEALESCREGDYSTGFVIHPSFDEALVNAAIESINS